MNVVTFYERNLIEWEKPEIIHEKRKNIFIQQVNSMLHDSRQKVGVQCKI